MSPLTPNNHRMDGFLSTVVKGDKVEVSSFAFFFRGIMLVVLHIHVLHLSRAKCAQTGTNGPQMLVLGLNDCAGECDGSPRGEKARGNLCGN